MKEESWESIEKQLNREYLEWIIALFMGVLLGFMVADLRSDEYYHRTAIEKGCAQYNPQTAKFEWIKKEGK